jgi:hypothetical protein
MKSDPKHIKGKYRRDERELNPKSIKGDERESSQNPIKGKCRRDERESDPKLLKYMVVKGGNPP